MQRGGPIFRESENLLSGLGGRSGGSSKGPSAPCQAWGSLKQPPRGDRAGVEMEERDFFRDRSAEDKFRRLMGGRSPSEVFSWRSPSFRRPGIAYRRVALSDDRLVGRRLVTVDGSLTISPDKAALSRALSWTTSSSACLHLAEVASEGPQAGIFISTSRPRASIPLRTWPSRPARRSSSSNRVSRAYWSAPPRRVVTVVSASSRMR